MKKSILLSRIFFGAATVLLHYRHLLMLAASVSNSGLYALGACFRHRHRRNAGGALGQDRIGASAMDGMYAIHKQQKRCLYR